MQEILAFLRNLDKRRLIYLLRRIAGLWDPPYPYRECRSSIRCPCSKSRPTQVTGVAIGAERACVQVR